MGAGGIAFNPPAFLEGVRQFACPELDGHRFKNGFRDLTITKERVLELSEG